MSHFKFCDFATLRELIRKITQSRKVAKFKNIIVRPFLPEAFGQVQVPACK